MAKAEIKIYGDIGDEITVASVNEQLEAIGKDVDQIDVYITSNGGSVIEGVGIANLLERHPAKIRTIVRGGALSIAGFVACAGDERVIEEDSVLHVHGPHYTVANGNMEDFEDAVEQLSRMKDSMARRYASITGKSTNEIKKLFERDHFYSPSEAVEIGFMTAIEPSSGNLAAFLDTENFQIPSKLEAALARRMESQPPEDDMSKSAATLEELKAKLPGASADFILSHALAKSTIDDAKTAYIDELEKSNKELAEKAAKAMEKSEPVDDDASAEEDYDEKLIEAIAAKVKSMLDAELMEVEEDVEAMEDGDDEEAEAAMEDDNEVDETVVAKMVEKAIAKALDSKASTKKIVRNRLGTKAVRKPTTTARAAATASAKAEVDRLAQAKVKDLGLTRPKAVAVVLKENPKLRERMVAEAN